MFDLSLIKKPVVTEKSQQLAFQGVYTLFVSDRATKIDVRNAIEKLYGVKVKKVTMIHTRAKVRVNGRRGTQIKRKERTKAMVTLQWDARIADLTKINQL